MRHAVRALSFAATLLLVPPSTPQAATDVAPGSAPSVRLGDLDADGDLDLVVGDQVWINDGAGRFTLAIPAEPGRSIAIGISDLEDRAAIEAMFASPDEGPGVPPDRGRARLAGRTSGAGGAVPGAMAIADPPRDLYLCLDGGDDKGVVADTSSLDLGTGDGEDFTIETFFYVPEPDIGGVQKLLWKDVSWGLQIIYDVVDEVDRIYFRIWKDATTNAYVYSDVAGLSGGWHHLAAIYDNEYGLYDALFLFLDGEQLSTPPSGVFDVTPGIFNSPYPVTVGDGYPSDATYPGMDEVRFSDVVRYSGSYTVPSTFTSDANTRALWHFDEFPGTTTFDDASIYANTLTGANGATICGACPALTVTPASLPGGAVDAAYSETLGASGGTAPYTFAVTAGSLPPGLLLGSGGALLGTPTTRGSYAFTVTATDDKDCTGTAGYTVDVIAAFGAPSDLVATTASASSVGVSWAPVDEAVEYEVWRSTSIATAYTFVNVAAGTTYTDSSGLAANTTYLYKVRAVSESATSQFSNVDAATTIVFTDAVPTTVRAVHVNQMRTAVDAMLTAAGQPAGTYTNDPVTAGVVIDADHITQLRTGLGTARSLIGLAALTYTDGTITPGSTVVTQAHVTETRAGTQ